MTKIKKISIIVPVYNVEKYLDQCITSIINQSMKELEIILVNDGSTDNSLQICNKYKALDERIIVLDKKWWALRCKELWIKVRKCRVYRIC